MIARRLALDKALPAQWIDEVFQEHRQRQYPRELLLSTVAELMMLVTLAALYAKIKRTEPAVLRALLQGSAQRLAPVESVPHSGIKTPGHPRAALPGFCCGGCWRTACWRCSSKRKSKPAAPRGYVGGGIARSHVSAVRVLKAAVQKR